MIREIESLSLKSANGTCSDTLPQEMVDLLGGDADIERLKVQL